MTLSRIRHIMFVGALVLMLALGGCSRNAEGPDGRSIDQGGTSVPTTPQADSGTNNGVITDTGTITGTGDSGESTDIGTSGEGSGEGSGGTNFGGTPLPTAAGQPTTNITTTQVVPSATP